MQGDGQFWLPPDFLPEHFSLDGTDRPRPLDVPSSDTGPKSPADTESDEEDVLARQITTTFLHDASPIQDLDTRKERTLWGSPQSTLCDLGIWSGSGKGGAPSEESTPPSTPLEQQRKGDALDLLSEAAGEVARLQGRGILGAPSSKPSLPVPVESNYISGGAGFYSSGERVQWYQQQYPTGWGRQQNMGYKGRGPSPAWPGSGMRAVFLTGNGTRKESAGTGVFLPRTPGKPTDQIRRKPGCSVLLPDRVIQALNLKLDDVGAAHGRGQRSPATQKDPAAAGEPLLRLPAEWTY